LIYSEARPLNASGRSDGCTPLIKLGPRLSSATTQDSITIRASCKYTFLFEEGRFFGSRQGLILGDLYSRTMSWLAIESSVRSGRQVTAEVRST
jgi:hypothetical protein